MIPESLEPMLHGSATDSMEIAKLIIGDRIQVDHGILAQLGEDKSLGRWARIAAIYALGFVGEVEFSPALRHVLSDKTDDLKVREHAAEALGNIGDREALELLRKVIETERSVKLRNSCEYALHELATL
jgi:HEAT repeat protein